MSLAYNEAMGPVKYVAISNSADVALVAAVTGKKIRVLQYTIVSGGTVGLRFTNGSGGAALTGVMPLVANSGVASPYCPVGLFETSITTALWFDVDAAITIYGHLTYQEV